uniref:Calcium channel, voltage-dependent, T type, alpha 1I subunit n=1 Tax=Nothobranchius kuhntae TaxID=321403 RepID=A0A1A8IHG7_NOTKU
MSRHATFENFGMAFLTLFQVSTGDNWNGIMKDTLRECPPGRPGGDYGCHAGLQFISPMYFVSFVLTAQFVLINVVVAVLMKHLDDSNKEAQEDAEMDAEIELELAQGGLCCMMGGIGAIAGATGSAATGMGMGPSAPGVITAGSVGGLSATMMAPLRDGAGGGASVHEGHAHHRCRLYSPAQESQWLDSVSLLIKDSLEGDMIDNLSGSIFHHYCSSPVCKDCKSHPQEIRLAEVEQASLMSEQLSDKSSSPALPDDLSLDEHSSYQLLVRDSQRGSSDSHSSEEFPTQRDYRGLPPSSSGSDGGVQELLEMNPPSLEQLSSEDGDRRKVSGVPSPMFHLPAEFFHPAAAAHSEGHSDRMSPREGGSFGVASLASWASLRSPGAHSRPLSPQHTSHSDLSLATGSSEGSLETTLVEGLGFRVSPPLDPPIPLLCPVPSLPSHSRGTPRPIQSQFLLKRRSSALTLQATRRQQRSESSIEGGGSWSGCSQQDSKHLSDEEMGLKTDRDSCHFNSEHLSETLNSLSLTSLLTSGSLAPTTMKKCNSTGSLNQSNLSAWSKDGRQFYGVDPHGFLSNPWAEGGAGGAQKDDLTSLRMKSSSRPTNISSRKKR